MRPGDRLTLVVDRPAAGGRMIARHADGIALVSATIPGETVEAEVEKIQGGTMWARTTRVLTPSPDRVEPSGDWSCGGNVFAHIAYARQLTIKRDIIRDAFRRIGRMETADDLPVQASAGDGYRMRARVHVQRGRIGFFREGSHQLCDPATTRQLLPATVAAIEHLAAAVATLPNGLVTDVDVSENCVADQRAIHLELADNADPSPLTRLATVAGVTGASCGPSRSHRTVTLWGDPELTDEIVVPWPGGKVTMTLSRHVRAFFQGNRFLLTSLVAAVMDVVPAGRIVELYAGVGLFSVALAARGGEVIAIEGDRMSARDLQKNAARAGGRIEARHQSVETFLSTADSATPDSVVVDPPRTGMSPEALSGVIALGGGRVVYVSCDVATLARDARTLVDAGYRLTALRAFDMFPNTAHVESLAVFERS